MPAAYERHPIRLLFVPESHWWLQVTRREIAPLSAVLPEAANVADDLDDWLDREDITDGVPYLISPALEYDIDLNLYFLRPALVGASRNTQLAAAGRPPIPGLPVVRPRGPRLERRS